MCTRKAEAIGTARANCVHLRGEDTVQDLLTHNNVESCYSFLVISCSWHNRLHREATNLLNSVWNANQKKQQVHLLKFAIIGKSNGN